MAAEIWKVRTTSLRDIPDVTAATIRSRKSTEYAFIPTVCHTLNCHANRYKSLELLNPLWEVAVVFDEKLL